MKPQHDDTASVIAAAIANQSAPAPVARPRSMCNGMPLDPNRNADDQVEATEAVSTAIDEAAERAEYQARNPTRVPTR